MYLYIRLHYKILRKKDKKKQTFIMKVKQISTNINLPYHNTRNTKNEEKWTRPDPIIRIGIPFGYLPINPVWASRHIRSLGTSCLNDREEKLSPSLRYSIHYYCFWDNHLQSNIIILVYWRLEDCNEVPTKCKDTPNPPNKQMERPFAFGLVNVVYCLLSY